MLEEVKDAHFTEEQYKMLLTYVESDICDVERQIVAFALLGTIIGKRINLPELHNLMKKGELCFRSGDDTRERETTK